MPATLFERLGGEDGITRLVDRHRRQPLPQPGHSHPLRTDQGSRRGGASLRRVPVRRQRRAAGLHRPRSAVDPQGHEHQRAGAHRRDRRHRRGDGQERPRSIRAERSRRRPVLVERRRAAALSRGSRPSPIHPRRTTMSAVLSPASPAIDLAAVKTRQQAAWSTGNYAVVGTTLQIVGESLCEALDLRAGARVLDVAAGNGNATLAAARRWCDVTSTDYVPALLEAGRARARADGYDDPVPGSRRRGPAVRRRVVRRGAVDLRRDVHPEPGPGGRRAGARLQARRQDRPGQLDARELHRAAVQDDRQVRPARAGRQVAGTVGHPGPARRAVRRDRARDPHDQPRSSRSAIARRHTGSTSSAPTTAR